MSKEFRNISVAFIVNDHDRILGSTGTYMYADDVVEELSDVIQDAITEWYHSRGRLLLAAEPIL